MSLASLRERRRQKAAAREQQGRHRSAEDGPREVVNIAWRPPQREPREPGAWGMWLARASVVVLGALMGYVSYWTQRQMVYAVKHDQLTASLEALGPDLGAVIFTALAHAEARRGRKALTLRLLAMACVAAAIGMNALAVGTTHLDQLAVAVLPPVLYAAASDRLIAVVGTQHRADEATGDDRSAWLLMARWVMGPFSACVALRRWVMDHVSATPGPSAAELRAAADAEQARAVSADADAQVRQAAEARRVELTEAQREHAQEVARLRAELDQARAASEIASGSKKDALLRLYTQLGEREDPRYGQRGAVAEVAALLAPDAGDLHPKTAEKYLREHLDREESAAINGRAHPAAGDMIGVTG